MTESIKIKNPQKIKTLILTTLFTLGILVSIGFWGVRQVEEETKSNLAEYLQTSLNSNIKILQFWMTEKKLDAEVLASEPDIQEKIFHLVKLSEKNTVTAK